MANFGLIHSIGSSMCVFLLLFSATCTASVQNHGQIKPGFQGSQMTWIDNNGYFLLSNNSDFAFGFEATAEVQLFLLVVVYINPKKIIWTANRGSPIQNSDKFVFDNNGTVSLQKGDSTVWSPDTAGVAVSAIEMQDSGNLVLVGNDGEPIWQSFSHPSDTLLSNQNFSEGMKLESDPIDDNISYYLEIKSGDMVLYAGYPTPQPYWSMKKESQKIIEKDGEAFSASIEGNSWRFYDKKQVLLWQFVILLSADTNSTWAATLGKDGFISFSTLSDGDSQVQNRIPADSCSTPGF